MKKLLLLILLPITMMAQNEFDQWRFGYGAGLDFTTDGADPVVVGSDISTAETAASVADCDGNLLFYTDGSTVWNRGNNVMANGTGLYGVAGAGYPPTQGAIIVRRPKSPYIYYIFTSSDIYGINFSIVNINSEGGLGRVIAKNIPLTPGKSQKLGVTYHGNGEDIWVMTHYENSNVYEAFLVTSSGVSPASAISVVGPTFTSSHGDLKFNQQGTKVAAVVQDQSLVTLADFNNVTGMVSNSFGILGEINNPHGCEFSPSGGKMYVTAFGAGGGVIQFDVRADNASTLRARVNLSGSFRPNGSLQLAPDGKIYVASSADLIGGGGSHLGVINFPESSDFLAGWERFAVNLSLAGGESSWELPNVTLIGDSIVVPESIIAANFCFEDSTTFQLDDESAIVDIIWDFGDPGSVIDNSSNLYRPTHVFSEPGTYTVNVDITTICGVEKYSREVVIDPGPVSSLDSINACPEVLTPIGFSPESGVDYNWSPSEGLSNSSISNPDFNPEEISGESMQYILSAVNDQGCMFLDTLQIEVFDKVDKREDEVLCPGFGVTLSLDSSIVSATWTGAGISDPSSLNPFVNPASSSDYIVEQTDSNGCVSYDTIFVEVTPEVPVDAGENQIICVGDSIAIGNNISPDSSVFSWDLAENVVAPLEAETFAFPPSSQWFYLMATNDTCSSIDSVFITVNDLPLVNISPSDTTMCYDDSVTFNATGASTYSWYDNNRFLGEGEDLLYISYESTTVLLEGVDTNGCVNRDSSLVTVLPLPEINISNDGAICIGQSITLNVSGGISYLWYDDVLSGSTESVVTLIPSETNTYSVRVNGSNGCYDLADVEVVVNSLPVIGVMSDTLICKESNAYLWATGGDSYLWSPSTYLSDSTGSNVVVASPESPITYQVTVVDSNGCIDSTETSISLNDNPIADFGYDYIPTCSGFEVQFSDSSQLADSYLWSFGDGNTSTEANPFYIFQFGSELTTTLTAVNNGICFDTASVSFDWENISEFLDVFIPNIFTPNNDGTNDCFEVIIPEEFEGCTNFVMLNRWGMKVFDSNEFKTDFCGVNAYNNQELPVGTYYYMVEIGDFKLNGYVQLAK